MQRRRSITSTGVLLARILTVSVALVATDTALTRERYPVVGGEDAGAVNVWRIAGRGA